MVKKKQWSWKNILLNTLAVVLTITPVASAGVWAVSAIKGDGRDIIELSIIEKATEPRLFDEPLISVTFDDGWESIYAHAAPVLSEYGIVTTQYIIPGEFQSPAYMSVRQVEHLRTVGHEIASHTYTHAKLTEVDDERLVDELKLSHDTLIKLKLAQKQMSFAPPNGAYDEQTTAEAQKYYGSQRNVKAYFGDGVDPRDVNLKQGFDRFDIIGYTVGPYTTIEQLKQAIAFTREQNGWLVLVYHQIEPEFQAELNGDGYNVTPNDFKAQMKLVKQSGIKTATVIDILGQPRERTHYAK